MPATVIVTPEASQESPSSVSEAVEEIAEANAEEAQAEAVETIADSSVQVAEIEAARDVAIAEINADVAQAQIEAQSEIVENEQWLRERLASLEAENLTLRGQLEASAAATEMALETIAEPINSEPSSLEETPLEMTETIEHSTPSDMSAPTSETLTEAILESVEEKPEPEILAVKRKPLIRLV